MSVLIPFIIGFAIAYVVYPMVDYFVALGLRKDRVVLVLYGCLMLSVTAMASLLWPLVTEEVQLFISKLPEYSQTLNTTLGVFNEKIQPTLQNVLGAKAHNIMLTFNLNDFIAITAQRVPENALNMAHVGMWLFIVPFVTFFALIQGEGWVDSIFNLTPSRYIESLLGMLAEINTTLGGYIRGQLAEATLVGTCTTVGLWGLGIEGAFVLGCLTGLFNLVPFLALIGGGSLCLVVALFQGQGPSVLMGILILFGVIRLMDDFIFIPFVVGTSVQLHPLVILFSVLAGYEMAGFLGLVFAVPATAIIKVILSALFQHHQERSYIKIPDLFS